MNDNSGDLKEKFHKLSGVVESEADNEPIISIGTAASMVNLSVSALRKYEKEGLLIYFRTPSGRRLLSRADVERIKIIQRLINDLGLNMEGIRRLLALLPCWELKPCPQEDKDVCIAVTEPVKPCWTVEDSMCARKGMDCRLCNVYKYGAYCTETIKMLLLNINR